MNRCYRVQPLVSFRLVDHGRNARDVRDMTRLKALRIALKERGRFCVCHRDSEISYLTRRLLDYLMLLKTTQQAWQHQGC